VTGFDPTAPQPWATPAPGGHHRTQAGSHEQHGRAKHDDEPPEHEVHSLRALFRQRRTSVRTMEPRLRLAVGAAAASLIGTVLLIALRDIGGANVSLGRNGSVVTAVSTPLFIATLVLLSLGLAYLLTGSVLASTPIAVIAIVVIMGEIGLHTGAFGTVFGLDLLSLFPTWAVWSARGTLAAIGLLAVGVVIYDRRRGHAVDRRMRLTLLAGFALLFGAYFVILKIGSPDVGHLDLFPESISTLMLDIADLVTPLLFIAAVDFGEWGGLLGERVGSALKAYRSWAMTVVAAVLALGLIAWGYSHLAGAWFTADRVWTAVRTTLIVGVTLVLMIVVGRALGLHKRRWPATFNVAGLFAAVALVLYVIAPLAGVIAGKFNGVTTPVEQVTPDGRYTSAADITVERGGKSDLAYSVLVPRGWIRDNQSNGTVIWLNSALPGETPGTFVKGLERMGVFTLSFAPTPEQLAAGLKSPIKGGVEHEGEFSVFDVDLSGGPAQMWLRPNGKGGSYAVEFTISGVPQARVEPTWKAIMETFRPGDEAPATLEEEPAPPESEQQKSNDRLQAASFYLLVPTAVLLLLLVGIFGRRWGARLVGAMLVFVMFVLAALLYFADEYARGLFGPDTHLPYVGSAGPFFAIGVLSLIALAIPFREPRRRRTLLVGLIGLLATVWTLVGMSVLYDHALAASRIAIWAAIIVLVAMAWDVVMSGESMTNEGSKRIPRASRVLAFLGYVILVAGTVLFYSGQQVTGTGQAAESMFEPESITRNGLFRLAFPLAVLMFLLRFGRNRPVGATPPSTGPGLGSGEGLGEQPERDGRVGDHRDDPRVLGATGGPLGASDASKGTVG
jgi:hypothetical protein